MLQIVSVIFHRMCCFVVQDGETLLHDLIGSRATDRLPSLDTLTDIVDRHPELINIQNILVGVFFIRV